MESRGEPETLARFLTQSKHFNSKGVTRRAFMPDPYKELSVSRVSSLDLTQIQGCGEEAVRDRGCPLYGWGKLSETHIIAQGLSIQPDEPPPFHAIIVGWPDNKEDRINIAQRLAEAVSEMHLL